MTAPPATNRFWPVRLGALRPLVGIGLLMPVLVLLTIFFLYPVFLIILRSFTEPVVGYQNYVALWREPADAKIVRNTFVIAFWTALICLLIAYPYAYHLSRLPTRIANIFLFLSVAPLFTAILARLYAWTVILGRKGIINEAAISLGVVPQPMDLLFTRGAVLIGMVHVLLPYMVIVLYSVMVGVNPALLEASRTLGAGRTQTFLRVFLPLSMPGVYAGALLVFIIALGFFITPAVLGGGQELTIAVFIEQQVSILRWGRAAAMAVVLLVLTVALFLAFDRLFGTQRLLVGGVRR